MEAPSHTVRNTIITMMAFAAGLTALALAAGAGLAIVIAIIIAALALPVVALLVIHHDEVPVEQLIRRHHH